MNLRNLFRRRPEAIEPTVKGERSIPSVNRAISMQARVTNTLVVSAVLLVGGMVLVWYYTTQVSQMRKAVAAKEAALDKRAASDRFVGKLGHIGPPVAASAVAPVAAASSSAAGWLDKPAAPPPVASAPRPVVAAAQGGTPQKTPEDFAREIVLSSSVIRSKASKASTPASSATGTAATASVRVLPDRHFLVTDDTTIPCITRTAIDSTLPGRVLCVGETSVWSADGSLVLLEQGTKYVGETRGEVRQGQARVGVIWTHATTPAGVRVELNSPGGDALGRAGLEGWVDNHFWDRFGAAVMLTLIDSSIALLASGGGGSGNTTVALNPSGVSTVATEALKSTVAIPPTIRIAQGERIQIMVARDVDFRSVYELRASK
jgi:type IV secretion system protein VirB10